MNKKFIKYLSFCICFILLVSIIVLTYMNTRVTYNPEGTTGNTTGNLNNNGMFCEYNGRIYFSNPSDSYCLYSMKPDCTDIKKINSDSVSSINAAGSYIYYIRNNVKHNNAATVFQGNTFGVIRCGLNGGNITSLYDNVAGVITLYGNYLYLQRYSNEDALTFWKIKIDKKESTKISNYGYFPASIYDNKIYYTNNTDNHSIYSYNIATGTSSMYLAANAYLTDMQGDYIYYIDLDNNYSLARVNTASGEKELLTDSSEGKCISYNVYKDVIFYYIEGANPALYRMNTDGTDNTLIMSGNICNINCTSNYTFFQLFNSDILYRVPTQSGTLVEQVMLFK